jgi:ABC-type uncharacterized transport system involved in gliding motility auxiliary subunit
MKKDNSIVLTGCLAIAAAVVCAVSAYLFSYIPLIWQISGGVAVVAFVVYLIQDRQAYRSALSRKTTQYGLNSVVMSVVVLGLVIFVNLIAVNHDWKKDFTKNRLHTLSEQSVKVVKGLTSEIRLKAFVGPNQIPEFQQVFDKYTYFTKMLKPEFVDVDRDPLVVKKYNIRQAGTIIVESDTRSARVDNLMGPDDPKLEEKLTNAIIQVAKGDKKKIYFLIGHGEHQISDAGRDGYTEIKDSLQSGRYDVAELNLLEKDKVPDDADVVIDAGPRSEILEPELKTLEAFLARGGKLLMMMEPNSPEILKGFLAKYGVDWHPMKAVLETNRLQQLAGGNPLTPIVTSYDTGNDITRDARQLSIFPIATPIEKMATPPVGDKVQALFSTSSRSLEVALQGDKVVVNEKTDRKGPISLALSITGKAADAAPPTPQKDKDGKDKTKTADAKKDNEFRMVVVGDSDFVSNGVRKFGINADLFQNMVSWLSHEEDLISIRPRPADTSELEITEERSRIINLASIVVAPLMMFLSGIMMWITRKRM